MSARQGHYLAQISLGRFLAERTIEPKLRNPIEAYAWWTAAGATKSAAKLLATFSQSDANAAVNAAHFGRLPRDYLTRLLSGNSVRGVVELRCAGGCGPGQRECVPHPANRARIRRLGEGEH